MQLFKYTEAELKEAIKTSRSMRQTLIKLSVAPAGGNYQTLKKAIEYFHIDISHFKGQGWNKGKTFQPKRPIEKYLSNEYPITSHRLRQRLLNENYFDHKCQKCNSLKWLGKPIPLELHHVDGNNQNNNLNNLQLLCPNCHAITDNFRGKNKRK